MRSIDCIVWHCSASKDGIAQSRDTIEAEHKARGFKTIGYHWLIEPDGILIHGRPESEVGAHVKDHNATTIGVCLIGTGKFTKAAWDAANVLRADLDARYHGVKHKGHRDFSPDLNKNGMVDSCEWIKVCPGFDVASWVAHGVPKLSVL